MATVDSKDDKMKSELENSKKADGVDESKDRKSRDKDKGESKKSKKHKKKRSPSPSDSSSSSRSRTRSRSSRKSKKHHRSSRRSRSRSHRDSKRRRSRSRSNRKSKKRSDSRDRRRGNSRDRTKKSEPPKKDSQKSRVNNAHKFDSPPKEMQLTEQTIDFSELGIPNIEALKEMYPAIKNMDPSELLQKLQLINDMKSLNSSKVDRKLYIGNIPAGITPQMLMDLLNSALQKMGINAEPAGNSIIGAWISPDNHYAFVDFRTPEEATNGFALNSVAIHGQTLKVGRPRSYQQTQTIQNPLTAILGTAGLPLNPLGILGQGEGTMTTTQKIQPPSRILILKNMLQIAELEIDEEYSEIFEDIKDECAKFGKVLSMKIPRPKSGAEVAGLGKVFVEFATLDEAKQARKELHGRTFAESTVEVSYHDENKYAQDDLSD